MKCGHDVMLDSQRSLRRFSNGLARIRRFRLAPRFAAMPIRSISRFRNRFTCLGFPFRCEASSSPTCSTIATASFSSVEIGD